MKARPERTTDAMPEAAGVDVALTFDVASVFRAFWGLVTVVAWLVIPTVVVVTILAFAFPNSQAAVLWSAAAQWIRSVLAPVGR